MEVVSFKIKNYKSIKDSGICYLDHYITVLAGKNEAGKTAILEALEDFNLERSIRKEAVPIGDESSKPEIELLIKLDKDDINKICKNFNIKNLKTNELRIRIKKIYPNNYEIDFSELLMEIFPEKEELENKLMDILKELEEKVINLPINEDYIKNQPYYIPSPDKFDNLKFVENLSHQHIKKVNETVNTLKKYVEKFNKIKEFIVLFETFCKNNFFPNFILFRSFDDILPSQIPISQAHQSEIIVDLSRISNLDLDIIRPTTEAGKRIQHKEEINIRINKDYEKFWFKDKSKLVVDWDSNYLYFFIKEGNKFYRPELRSKGRQWHLSFYIRVTARSIEGRKNIILIDEPGLFLHAEAQRYILKKLEDCARRTQIIYTTHSPYLIQSDKLNRVRLVIKYENEGTKIEKITAKADRETLTPILTAIGEDLSLGIRVDKKNTIVVEGFSDYLYLLAFKRLLGINEEFNFVPSVGADNVLNIGAILFGWSLDPIFILDNDNKGRKVKEKLIEGLGIDENRIILVPFNKEGCIENLFSKRDFKKYVSFSKSMDSKVIVANQFYQKVERGEITLSNFTDETIENFSRVFEKLEEVIKNET